MSCSMLIKSRGAARASLAAAKIAEQTTYSTLRLSTSSRSFHTASLIRSAHPHNAVLFIDAGASGSTSDEQDAGQANCGRLCCTQSGDTLTLPSILLLLVLVDPCSSTSFHGRHRNVAVIVPSHIPNNCSISPAIVERVDRFTIPTSRLIVL